MTTKQQSQRNRIRALHQSGFGKKDIARLVGVPYSQVNLAIGDTRVLTEVERAAVKLLAEKPDDPAWRKLVTANFGEVTT